MYGSPDVRFSRLLQGTVSVVGGSADERSALAAAVADVDQSLAVETAGFGEQSSPSGPLDCVVCLAPSPASLADVADAVETPEADVTPPLVVLGEGVDAAAAYDAGASDVIPLDPQDHTVTAAEQVVDIAHRHWQGTVATDLFDAGADGALLHDPETAEVVACNRSFYDLLGYDPATDTIELDDIAGHDSAFSREQAVEYVQQAAAGESTTFEWKDPTASGAETWVEVTLERGTVAGAAYVVATVRDIDERKRREAALKTERSRLTDTFERVSDALFAVDEEWTLTYANDQGEAVLRHAARSDDPEALMGRDLWELVPDAVDTMFDDAYHRAMREQEPVTFEAPFEPMDAWFQVRAYPDESGLSVYFTDITERKEREKQRKQYETILASLDDAVYAIEPDGTIDYVNEKYASMKGVPREELLGTNIYDWVDDDTGERATELREAFGDDAAEVGIMEYEFQTVDGETIPAEMRFTRVAEDDGNLGRVGVIRDVTERKERERELYIRQRVLDEAAIPLALSDPDQSDNPLVYVNDAFLDLTGYDEAEVLGRNCRFMQGPDTDPETVHELREHIDAEETITTTICNYRADGTSFWNELTVTPIYDTDGSLLRFLATQSDVTQRRRNEIVRHELLSTTRQLMDARSTDEVATIVSEAASSILGHDLCVVYLDEDGGDLTPAAWPDAVDAIGGPPAPSDDGPVSEALRRGEPVVSNAYDDAELENETGAVALQSVLALPLGDHGVLAAGIDEPDGFSQSSIDRGELLTLNAARALDRVGRREELERYETLFETVQDKLYVLDEDGYVELVSEPLAAEVGMDRAAIEGRHLSSFTTEETVKEGDALIMDLLVTPDSVSSTYEGTLVAVDGTETPIEIELSILPYDDHFRGTVGAVRDISERRRRRRELRVIQEAIDEAGVGLMLYDEDGEFAYVNDHYAEMLGWTADALETIPVWDVFEAVTRETFGTYWESFSLDETRTTETEHQRADQSTVPVETVTTAVAIDGEEYNVVTVRDITSRRERRQQSEVLHRVIRHNLRNELTVIRGHAQNIATQLDGREADSAETIVDRADTLVDLTTTAQDAETVISSDTVRRPVALATTLRQVVSDVRSDFDCHVVTDLPDAQRVLGDDSLGIALEQLVTNAVEHNDTDKPTVWVTLSDGDRPGWVSIEIADDGPGIPEHERSVLTAGEETKLRHGSGLGLWVVHWVVTRYGGELAFEERPGGGSLVRIDLPAAPASPDVDGTASVESTESD